MSSLVAYDDSESEDDSLDEKEKTAPAFVQSVSCKKSQKTMEFIGPTIIPSPASLDPNHAILGYHGDFSERSSSSLQLNFQPQSCKGSERKKHFRDSAAPTSSPANQGKCASLQVPACIPKSFSNVSNPGKRQPSLLTCVRPYIPKRQRLATSVETVGLEQPSEQVLGTQSRESQIVFSVSSRVKPYLSEKPRAAGVPRKLLMSLGGHQGPVNTVQWCPVPHLSHLLLSASMDKTFKVMTATVYLSPLEMMMLNLGCNEKQNPMLVYFKDFFFI